MRATSSEGIQGEVETTLQSRTVQQQSPTSIPGSVELAVVIPTLNERENVSQLLERIDIALKGIKWEVIFVDDDSTDGTTQLVRQIARHRTEVRIIHRIGRRGLASACVEGILSSSAPCVAVMDADMQHDEAVLPQMLQVLKEQDLDIVVGSRYSEGGGVKGWDKRRLLMSRIAGLLARIITKANLHDPMSGFFVMRRETFDRRSSPLITTGIQNTSRHIRLIADGFADCGSAVSISCAHLRR